MTLRRQNVKVLGEKGPSDADAGWPWFLSFVTGFCTPLHTPPFLWSLRHPSSSVPRDGLEDAWNARHLSAGQTPGNQSVDSGVLVPGPARGGRDASVGGVLASCRGTDPYGDGLAIQTVERPALPAVSPPTGRSDRLRDRNRPARLPQAAPPLPFGHTAAPPSSSPPTGPSRTGSPSSTILAQSALDRLA